MVVFISLLWMGRGHAWLGGRIVMSGTDLRALFLRRGISQLRVFLQGLFMLKDTRVKFNL
jgi:hypothetical protein